MYPIRSRCAATCFAQQRSDPRSNLFKRIPLLFKSRVSIRLCCAKLKFWVHTEGNLPGQLLCWGGGKLGANLLGCLLCNLLYVAAAVEEIQEDRTGDARQAQSARTKKMQKCLLPCNHGWEKTDQIRSACGVVSAEANENGSPAAR